MRAAASRVPCRVLVLSVVTAVTAAASGAVAAERGAGKTVIAALPFRDNSPSKDYAPLAEALGDMMISFLSQAETWRFVERSALETILKEQELSLTGLVDDAAKAKVGRLLGAKHLLTGGLTVTGKTLRINAHLFEVETTRVARSQQATGKVDDLEDLVAEVARKLAQDPDLKLPELRKDQVDKSPQANLHFMRGLGYHYGAMPDHAIVEFMKAVNLKPDHARAWYWTGKCYYDDKEHAHALIEFARFLKDFPTHSLAAGVKELAAACTVQTQKSRADDRAK